MLNKLSLQFLFFFLLHCSKGIILPDHALHRNVEITRYLVDLCQENHLNRVLDLGPGGFNSMFPLATHIVDYRIFPEIPTLIEQYVVDIDQERLPFPDKYFDFVYSRHVLEDLHNPMGIFKELVRVSKVGYIETPSPAAEFVSHDNYPFLGFVHHRFFLYSNISDNTLYLIPKYSVLEYLQMDAYFQQITDKAIDLLQLNNYNWNNYYVWSDFDPHHQPNYKILQHEVGPYDLRQLATYLLTIDRAMESSAEATHGFVSSNPIHNDFGIER